MFIICIRDRIREGRWVICFGVVGEVWVGVGLGYLCGGRGYGICRVDFFIGYGRYRVFKGL